MYEDDILLGSAFLFLLPLPGAGDQITVLLRSCLGRAQMSQQLPTSSSVLCLDEERAGDL